MTHDAVLAILLGSAVALVLLVPTAAVQYRIDGRLGPADLAILLTAAVYGVALWTYTLLPLPAPGAYRCLTAQTDLLGSVRPVLNDYTGLRALLRDSAFLQLGLNVLLFVPFGYFVRRIAGRGVVVATALGLGTSLLIECTQRTGDWGLYHCAYRLFDVDDLVTNTLGALVGSVLSLLLVHRRAPEALPTTVSLGRRLVGMVSDVLVVGLLGTGAAVAYRTFQTHGFSRQRTQGHVDLGVQSLLQWWLPLLVEAAFVLLAGRTVGELVVSTRAVARHPGLTPLSRVVKLVTGVGVAVAIIGLNLPHALGLLAAYGALSVLVAVLTREARGLSHVLAGMDLRVHDPSAGGG